MNKRLIVRTIQVVLIIGILSLVYFCRGPMDMFDADLAMGGVRDENRN